MEGEGIAYICGIGRGQRRFQETLRERPRSTHVQIV